MVKTLFLLSTLALIFAPPTSPLIAQSSLKSKTDSGGESSLNLGLSGESDVVGLTSASSVQLATSSPGTKIVQSARRHQSHRNLRPCRAGYFRDPRTNYCRKITTVFVSKTTITTVTYDIWTGRKTVHKTCRNGYWWNSRSGRCNRRVSCAIGYIWNANTNRCQRIVCPFGFRVQDRSNVCRRIVCQEGQIINQRTGNCIINPHGTFKVCKKGWTLDLRTLRCALIGTKGSNDPRSLAAKRSQKSVPKTPKFCPAGKFLNPKTNRCKKLQEVHETSTGKTITTYDPKTGEAKIEKICHTSYTLSQDTNRCVKIKAEDSSNSSNASVSSDNISNSSNGSIPSSQASSSVSGSSSTSFNSSTASGPNPSSQDASNNPDSPGTDKNKTSQDLKTKTGRKSRKKSSSGHTASVKDPKSTTLKTCPAGKVINPSTNRCKNLETISESTTGKTISTFDPATGQTTSRKICHPGYELSPESNRCKKVKQNKGASDKMEVPKLGDKAKDHFVATGSIVGVASVGTGFAILQFRREILHFLLTLFKKS